MNAIVQANPRSLPPAAPLLSVCLAVGPGEPLEPVLATIESVLTQKRADVEVVVKSAGHHLEETLRSYVDSNVAGRVQLIFGRDSGIYDAFNICVAAARGCYLMFLGCGDTLAHQQVAELVATTLRVTPEVTPVLYGSVLLKAGSGQTTSEFDNRCFFGKRARLPWRNPCHHQGLIYRRSWLAVRPFRTDIGPLADSVHNYQHRVFDIAKWLGQPVSVFQEGGASTRRNLSASARRMRTVLVNCEFFWPPIAWKALSIAVLGTRYIFDRMRIIFGFLQK